MQHVLLIGLNHNTAPIEVRETVSFSKDQLPAALSQLNEFAKEAVIVSTCNRTEIYTVTDDITETSNLVRSFLAEFHDVSRGEISPYLYELTDTEAVRHVLNVTSGMDSLVLGEPQILGQVRDAYTAAVEARSARIGLSKLFHKALRVGKRARRETDIGRHAMSVSYVCVELVRKELGELRDHSALLVGVGDAGKLACQALAKAGIGQINVTNRTYERAQDLADKLGGVALPFEQLNEAMSQASIIITATGSSSHVINAASVREAVEQRGGEPLVLMDIAVPRDVEPEVGSIPSVSLFDIDDLKAVSISNREQREAEAEKVEEIIDVEISEFSGWWASLPAETTIAALHGQAEDLRQRELARFLRAENRLTDQQQIILEEMSRSLVKKLLHYPCASLRGDGQPTDVDTVGRLFKLASSDVER
ncbi:MAG: glutamyl-tRNA reductase [SAR202 cluster bacterium]|nr:glutamyl-tRNA reductase [SAR202 cluster bacterium]